MRKPMSEISTKEIVRRICPNAMHALIHLKVHAEFRHRGVKIVNSAVVNSIPDHRPSTFASDLMISYFVVVWR